MRKFLVPERGRAASLSFRPDSAAGAIKGYPSPDSKALALGGPAI